MSPITEEGILLRAHPYSETSRILRILTPNHGVLSGLARGVRRRSSRGQSALDTFCDLTIVVRIRPERELQTLREVEVIRARRGIGRDAERFAGASLVTELLLAHTLQAAGLPLFDFVRGALDRIEAGGRGAAGAEAVAAGWRILGEAGFLPELENCVRCGAELPPEGLLRFSASGGGIHCATCGVGGAGPRLGPGARADLQVLVRGRPPRSLRGAAAHLGLLEGFALRHFSPNRPLRSPGLLRPFLEASDEHA